jgi:hypothetical protein
MSVKQELYKYCEVFIENRLNTVKNSIEELQESLLSETKSSAGDKHETGRAMLQLEREKAGQKLLEINKTRTILSRVGIHKKTDIISLGALVYTSQSNYFISISAGEIILKDISYYAISSNTPIGKLLFGKTVGDSICFNGNNIEIEAIE